MGNLQQYRSLFSLQETIVLVAGGSGGIGSVLSEGFAALGASVVVWDYDIERAVKLVEKITEQQPQGKIVAFPLDARDVHDINEKVNSIVQMFGKIDVLVNCVGTHIEQAAEEFTEEHWDTVMSINLKSAFFLSQAVAKAQIEGATGGSHIHLSSVRSALGIQRGYSAYCASKGGLNMMIKQLSTEWAKYHIRVNGIAPTFTRTPLVTQYLEDPVFLQNLVARIPAGRICEPLDLAGLAMFLAMPASDFIQGQIIYADGGLTATQ